jgi:hypothetical protein
LHSWKQLDAPLPPDQQEVVLADIVPGETLFVPFQLPHALAVERALEAVAVMNDTIDKMGSIGELKAFNRAFKEARKVDPAIRYFDYIHARKAAMLEALAREATQ